MYNGFQELRSTEYTRKKGSEGKTHEPSSKTRNKESVTKLRSTEYTGKKGSGSETPEPSSKTRSAKERKGKERLVSSKEGGQTGDTPPKERERCGSALAVDSVAVGR